MEVSNLVVLYALTLLVMADGVLEIFFFSEKFLYLWRSVYKTTLDLSNTEDSEILCRIHPRHNRQKIHIRILSH